MNKYLNEFFTLKCAGDVLNAVGPIAKGPKEITEAMSMRELLRSIMIPHPMEYVLVDMCSGNGLVSALSAFTLPSFYNIAVDKKKRNLGPINRFAYFEQDINYLYCLDEIPDYRKIYVQHKRDKKYMLVGMHSCKSLSKQIINIFLRSPECEYLLLCPCCTDTLRSPTARFVATQKHITKYDAWIVELIDNLTHNRMFNDKIGVSVTTDNHSLSPRNKIIQVWRDCANDVAESS